MFRPYSIFYVMVLLGACREYEKDFLYPTGVDEDEDDYFLNADELGVSTLQADCDDSDPEVHPGATDECNTGTDEDCVYKASCYLWSDQDMDGSTARKWQGEMATGQLGAAVAGWSTGSEPLAVVSAPYQDAYAGAVYLVPWDVDAGAAAISTSDGFMLAGAAGDRLGTALLADVQFTATGPSYLIIGGPTRGEGGAIFSVDSKTLDIDLDSPMFEAESSAPVGEVIAWSASILAGDEQITMLLGAPTTSSALLLACTEGTDPSCEEHLRIDGEENTSFGASMATLSEPNDWLVVGAPAGDQVFVFDQERLLEGEDLSTSVAALTLTGSGDGAFGAVVIAADIWPTAGGDGNDDLLVSDPTSDTVYLFDGLALRAWAAEGGSIRSYSERTLELRGQEGSSFGAAISASMNLDDHEGLDLLVGAPTADGSIAGGAVTGVVWILQSAAGLLYGDATTLQVDELAPALIGGAADARLGSAVSTVASMNEEDVYPELLIGASGESGGGLDAGAFFVVKGVGE